MSAVDTLAWAVDGPPVGTWVTSAGSFDGVMQDVLTFATDGTGWVRTQSALRGAELLPLMWRQPGPGRLEIAVLHPDDDPREAPYYEKLRYEAREATTDLGAAKVLQNIDDEVFWFLAGPLVLRDRVPRPPPESP